MLVWRYRRLLQAETTDAALQIQGSENAYQSRKSEGAQNARGAEGLICRGIEYYNAEALSESIATFRKLSREISERGLGWESDRKALREAYNPLATRRRGAGAVVRDL